MFDCDLQTLQAYSVLGPTLPTFLWRPSLPQAVDPHLLILFVFRSFPVILFGHLHPDHRLAFASFFVCDAPILRGQFVFLRMLRLLFRGSFLAHLCLFAHTHAHMHESTQTFTQTCVCA